MQAKRSFPVLALLACALSLAACGAGRPRRALLRSEIIPSGTVMRFGATASVVDGSVRVEVTASRLAGCQVREIWTGVPRGEEIVSRPRQPCARAEAEPAPGVEVVLFAADQRVTSARTHADGVVTFDTRPAHFLRFRRTLAVGVPGEEAQVIGEGLVDVVGDAEAAVEAAAQVAARAEVAARETAAAERTRVLATTAAAERVEGRCSADSRSRLEGALADLHERLRAEAASYRHRFLVVLDQQFVVAEPEPVPFRVRPVADHVHLLVLSLLPVALTVSDGAGTPIERSTEWADVWTSSFSADGRELFPSRGEALDVRVRGDGCTLLVLIEE